MAHAADEHPWETLRRIADAGDSAQLSEQLAALPPGEAVRALSRLDPDDQAKILALLEPEAAADLVEQMAEVQAADLIEVLSPPEAAAILHELPSNEQADVLAELPGENAEAILAAMDPREASAVRTLASYPPDVAGGLMITEYLAFPEHATVSDVIENLRRHVDTYADYQVQYVYVTQDSRRLAGVLRLRDLLWSRPETALGQLMITDPLAVADRQSLDDLKELFDRYQFLGIPVVDEARHLVGVLRRGDVDEALAQRADSDYRKSQGIVGGEELRTMPVLRRSGRRLSWLSINILLNVLAASIIAIYQDTLAAVIALAAFLPIISDMSGCSGNQAVAVSMRELALGLVRPADVGRVWLKELTVGLINGIALGALLGFVAWLWKGNVFLGLVVGSALALNTVVSVSIGGTVPLMLRRLGVDPALASGPILTTVTDMCGFFFALSLAAALVSRLAL